VLIDMKGGNLDVEPVPKGNGTIDATDSAALRVGPGGRSARHIIACKLIRENMFPHACRTVDDVVSKSDWPYLDHCLRLGMTKCVKPLTFN